MTTLNWLIAVLGAVTTLLGAFLSILALRRRIEAGLSEMMRNVLLETGLIKYESRDQLQAWPNGSTNLPDFLEEIWEKLGDG